MVLHWNSMVFHWDFLVFNEDFRMIDPLVNCYIDYGKWQFLLRKLTGNIKPLVDEYHAYIYIYTGWW